MHALNSSILPEEEKEPLLIVPCLISMRIAAWELGRAGPWSAPASQFYKVRRSLGPHPAVISAMESIFTAYFCFTTWQYICIFTPSFFLEPSIPLCSVIHTSRHSCSSVYHSSVSFAGSSSSLSPNLNISQESVLYLLPFPPSRDFIRFPGLA